LERIGVKSVGDEGLRRRGGWTEWIHGGLYSVEQR
jgi:hypothetical protein